MIGVRCRPMAFDTVIWCYPRTVGNATTFQLGGILVRKQEWPESTHNKKQNMKRQRERPTWMLENQSSVQTVSKSKNLPTKPSCLVGSEAPLGNPSRGFLLTMSGKYLPTGAFGLSTSTC